MSSVEFASLAGALVHLAALRQIHPAKAQQQQRAQPLRPEQHGRAEGEAHAGDHGQEESGKQTNIQGDHGTRKHTFVDFTWIVSLPAAFGLNRQKPGRIGIAN